MIHTILVPLDGSRLAEQALPEARRLARAADAAIVLVRVARMGARRDRLAAHFAAIEEAEEYLRMKARVLASEGVSVRTSVFSKDPAEGISLAAMVHGATLIVMSTHGRSGMRRAVLGSVAEQVVHAASIPVLLVRSVRRTAYTGPVRKILVPLDGTELAESALRYVAQEQFAQSAEITLLRTVALPITTSPTVLNGYLSESLYEQVEQETEFECREASRYLYCVALTYLDSRPWQARVAMGAPAEQMLEVANADMIDFIVMATHGRRGVDRLLHGSVAAHVLHHTHVPLLLLHGTNAAAGATERAPREALQPV
jgi:nucleotide-binding universal stress UspA family protein